MSKPTTDKKDGLIFVVPAPGRTVRDHRTRLVVPAAGAWVADSDPHWMALLNFGDLVEADAPADEPEPSVVSPAGAPADSPAESPAESSAESNADPGPGPDHGET